MMLVVENKKHDSCSSRRYNVTAVLLSLTTLSLRPLEVVSLWRRCSEAAALISARVPAVIIVGHSSHGGQIVGWKRDTKQRALDH